MKVLMHSLGHWRLEPGLHDLAFLPNIVQPASRLLVQGQQVREILIINIGEAASLLPAESWARTSPKGRTPTYTALCCCKT